MEAPEFRAHRALPGASQGSACGDPCASPEVDIAAAGGCHATPEVHPCSDAVFMGDVGESAGCLSVPRGGFAAAFTDEQLK